MSFRKQTIAFVHCDNCHAEVQHAAAERWFAWVVPGEEGEMKHNCPRCHDADMERMMAGDPPG